MTPRQACAFCDVERVHLAETQLAYAFEDEHPVSPGHALVVTRRHITTYFDCTPARSKQTCTYARRRTRLASSIVHRQ